MRVFVLALMVLSMAGCPISGDTYSALFDRVNAGDVDAVRKIIDAHPNVKDEYLNDGWTALTISARNGNADVTTMLIEQGADVNRLEGGGNSPLFWAVYYEHIDVVNILLRAGAEVHKKCGECEDPVSVGRRNGNEKILRLLLEADESRK